MIDIQISDQPLMLQEAIQSVRAAGCGALITFSGTVRNQTAGKKVCCLEYECYYPMAIKEMEAIAGKVIKNYEIQAISMHHRMGRLIPEDIAVHIAVGAAHRAAAFAACQSAIDQLKQRVPIWKKEVFEDGAVWVSAHA